MMSKTSNKPSAKVQYSNIQLLVKCAIKVLEADDYLYKFKTKIAFSLLFSEVIAVLGWQFVVLQNFRLKHVFFFYSSRVENAVKLAMTVVHKCVMQYGMFPDDLTIILCIAFFLCCSLHFAKPPLPFTRSYYRDLFL